MQTQHVPVISLHYWLVFAVATLFGANAGDLIVGQLARWDLDAFHLPLLAIVVLAVLVAEVLDKSPGTRWYWLAIIVIPMLSNDLGATSASYFGIDRIWIFAGIAVVLVVTFLVVRSDAMHLVAMSLMLRPKPAVPLTDACYWIAMVLAAALGYVASDHLIYSLGLAPRWSALILATLVALASYLFVKRVSNRALLYWFMIVAINSTANSLGIFLAGPRVGIGLFASVAAAGLVLAALLLFRPREDSATAP